MVSKPTIYTAYFIALYLNIAHAIYDPTNQLSSRYKTHPVETGPTAYADSPVKTLSWQRFLKNDTTHVQMHHNYSKVSHQSTVNVNNMATTTTTTTTPVPLARKPRNYYHEAKPLQIQRERQQLVDTHRDRCPQGYTGQIPLTDSCHMFLNCHKGRGISQPCAPGTLFNPRILECDHAHKVTCLNADEATDKKKRLREQLRMPDMRTLRSDNIVEQVQMCPTGFVGRMPNYGDCSKYIVCEGGSSGRKVLMDCAPGTLFDCKSNICKFPREADCFHGADLQQSETQLPLQPYKQQPVQRQYGGYNEHSEGSMTESVDYMCGSGNVGVLLAHPVHCDQYVQCDIGRAHVRPCAPGTHFNPTLSVCDWPSNVNCQQSPYQPTLDIRANRNNNNYNGPGDNRDSRFHNGYTNEFNGQHGPAVNHTNTNVFNLSSSVEYNPQKHQFDSEYHDNFGTIATNIRPTTFDMSDYHNGGQNNNEFYLTTTQRSTVDIGGEGEGGYGYYQVRPTRMSPQSTNAETGRGAAQQWPPPFPDAVNTDYDYVIDYDQLAEATLPPPTTTTTTTTKPFRLQHVTNGNNGQSNCQQDMTSFQCETNECVHISLVCDTKKNCRNGRDEYNCAESIVQFTQTKAAKLAIKEYVKYRNVSVTYCAKLCHEMTEFICKSFNYREIDSNCFLLCANVAETGLLIQMGTYTYYEHTIYSIDCTDLYRCKNKKCIDRSKVCDGIDDCLDRQDERDCAANVFGYELTLETPGGYQVNEGNLVVTAFGRRGYICDDGFTLINAHVACKELGYRLGALQVRPSSHYLMRGDPMFKHSNSTFYIMDDVVCSGEEMQLKDCHFAGWGVNDCKDDEAVGVICQMHDTIIASLTTTPKTTQHQHQHQQQPIGEQDQQQQQIELCRSSEWLCHSQTECLPLQYLCDGIYDCADHSDEWERLCKSPVQVRLVGKPITNTNTNTNAHAHHREGRVEVRYHGSWGSVCDDGFNDKEATVVCKQLVAEENGGGAAIVIGKVLRNAPYRPGSGPIWLDQLTCSGNETNLADCGHAHWNEHNCDHNEDVAIQCITNTLSPQQQQQQHNIKGTFHTQQKQQYDDGFRRSNREDLEVYRYPGKCGVRSDDLMKSGATFRVLNAPSAPPGTYPWQATISLRSDNVSKAVHWCGAVIISPLYVLTAAHCLDGVRKSNIQLHAGDYDREIDEGTEQMAQVDDYIQHEEFRHGSRKNNDIAVLRLKEPGFNMTDDVKAICLPDVDVEYKGGTGCAISGFGVTQQSVKKASRQLKAAWIPIQHRAVCKMAHIYGNEMMEGMFCAGSLDGGVDACDGDSGGPLACLHEGYYTLFGITSWGHKCGEANKPGVYVKVAYYRQWIQDAIDKLTIH